MRPVSSSNSGLAPLRRATAAIAAPRSWSEIPEESWKLANESNSGEVRTPPKSLMIASISLTKSRRLLHAEQVDAGSVPVTGVPAKQRRVQREAVNRPVDARAKRLTREPARVLALSLLPALLT